MRTLLLVTVMLAQVACTSMLLGNTSSRESAAATSGTSTSSAADSAISGEVRRRLSDDPDLKDYAIGIRTQGGRVTLSGTVGSYPHRDKAVAITRQTDGVSNVDNRIIVNTNL